jgi:hypothetical protein
MRLSAFRFPFSSYALLEALIVMAPVTTAGVI